MLWHWKCLLQGGTEMKLSPQVPSWPPTPEGSALFPEHPHPGISVLLAAAPARTHWKVREPQEGSCSPHM
ncbi:hypothetical protein VULLAG_LOCUS5372 [Vulpes lagopus]